MSLATSMLLSAQDCNQPTITSVTSTPDCSTGTATITVDGNLNGATEWVLYSGACADVREDSSTDGIFTVTPDSGTGTAFYVRAEGGCVAFEGGTPIFEEQFDGEVPSSWDIGPGSPVGAVWAWAYNGLPHSVNADGTTYVASFLGGTIVGINSPTADNGALQFNSDAYATNGTYSLTGGPYPGPHNSSIVSPSVDCSSLATVFLEFNQYFRRFEDVTSTVSVSNDGGASWTDYIINDQIAINQSTPLDDVQSIDISSVAANQADVKVRFNWTDTNSGLYFWVIDDVKILEMPSASNSDGTCVSVFVPALDCCDLAITNTSTTVGDCPTSSLMIEASCSTCAGLEYSIGGAFQPEGTFDGLPAGTYTVTVRDTGDPTCTDTSVDVFVDAGTDSEDPVITCPAPITVSNDPGTCAATITSLPAATVTDNCSTFEGNSVLVLWDRLEDAGTCSLIGSLRTAGFAVTLSDVPESQYDGTNPAPTGFDAVIHLNCITWSQEMPVAGQETLVDYVFNEGGTYISSEWNTYDIATGTYTELEPLVLLAYNGFTYSEETYTTVPGQAGHPLLTNVDNAFTSTRSGHNQGNVKTYATDPAEVLMTTDNGDAVVLRELSNGGKIVSFQHTGSEGQNPVDGSILTLANIQQLYINAVDYSDGVVGNSTNGSVQLLGAPDLCSPVAVGEYLLTYVATDGSGNSDQCMVTLTVEDDDAPNVFCRNLNVDIQSNGTATITTAQVLTGIVDNCTGVAFSLSEDTFDCEDIGTTQAVTLTATDIGGNDGTCVAQITVNDNLGNCCDLAINSVTPNAPLCPGGIDGTITIDASCTTCDGLEYSIGAGFQPGNTFVGQSAGNFTITVRDTGNPSCSVMMPGVTIEAGEDNTPPSISNCQPVSAVVIADNGCIFNGSPGSFFVEENCPTGLQITERYFDENGTNYLTLTFNEFLGSRSLGTFRNLPLGQNTIELTLRDASGNEDDCSFDITVVSNIVLPTAPAPLSFQCEDEVPDPITLTAEDDCFGTITGVVMESDNGGSGCLGDPLVITRTWTFDNGSDIANEVSRMITVEDTEAPVFDLACQVDLTFTTEDGNVCPADATISLSEGDEFSIFDAWSVGGNTIASLEGCVMDNCTDDSDLTITVDDITVADNGTCSRTITVTFIADDGCGNFSDPFVCNYTFIDNSGPAISFDGIPDGGTRVVECDLPSETSDPLIDFNDLTITDDCSDVDLSTLTEELTQLYAGPCSGDLLTRFQQVFTVSDICGNESTYTLITEIMDTTPPAFTESPADLTVECVEDAPAPQLVATDACSEIVYNFQEVRTDGNCPGSYTLTRTWLASDGCGNTSVEQQVVTVEDTTGPEITFIDGYINQYEPGQDVYVECSEYGNISLLIANNAIAVDACNGSTEVTYTLEDLGGFDCAEFGYSGAFVSTWTSKDDCGNITTATLNWFLVDETAPTFQNLPDDTCADADNLPPVADVQAVDQCELAALTFHQSEPLDCDSGGQYIERTWTAEDACGNIATHTQRITLGGANGLNIAIDYPGIGEVENGDIIQLAADCTAEDALSLEELEAAITVADGCSDNSSEATIEISLMDEGDCAENGYVARYLVSITANDACGNTANFDLTIDFVDQTPPLIEGDTEIRVNCGEDMPMPVARDACSEVASMTFVDSAPMEVSCPNNPVSYERIWTATDNCGNTATFTQLIAVIDTEGPVFSGVPADACDNTSIEVEVTAIDRCTGEQAEVFFDEMLNIEDGCGAILTRTWTATDACGNTSTAMQQVFFNDDIAPAIEFNNDLLFGVQSGDEIFFTVGDGLGDPNDPLLFTAEDVIVTDNCATLTAEVFVETTLSEDCAEDGYLAQYNYQFVATDPCGNSSSAMLTVFYVDDKAPDLFGVPGNETLFCEAAPAPAEVTASDDYSGQVDVVFSEVETGTPEGLLITRTWTATDDCGNTNSASQEIFLTDNGLSASFSFDNAGIECNSDDNRLSVTAMGGTLPYSYQWQLTSPLEDGLITTDPTRRGILFTMGYITQTFSVLITDANGCELLAEVTVVCDFDDDEGNFAGNGNAFNTTLSVYPNPADQQFLVKANDLVDTPVTVGLYNLFGQELLRKEVDSWTVEGITIDTRQYPNGTYLLRFAAEGKEVQAREIVILH